MHFGSCEVRRLSLHGLRIFYEVKQRKENVVTVSQEEPNPGRPHGKRYSIPLRHRNQPEIFGIFLNIYRVTLSTIER